MRKVSVTGVGQQILDEFPSIKFNVNSFLICQVTSLVQMAGQSDL